MVLKSSKTLDWSDRYNSCPSWRWCYGAWKKLKKNISWGESLNTDGSSGGLGVRASCNIRRHENWNQDSLCLVVAGMMTG